MAFCCVDAVDIIDVDDAGCTETAQELGQELHVQSQSVSGVLQEEGPVQLT